MSKMNEAKDSIFKDSTEPEGLEIKGFDFSKQPTLNKLIESFYSTGFQASHLGRAIEVGKKMRKEKVTIFLGFGADAVASGVRESISYLVKNKIVHALVTTADGIEADVIRTKKDFVLNGKGKRGDNFVGNIMIPGDGYKIFTDLLSKVLTELYEEQKKSGEIATPGKITKSLGKMCDETSILYWAQKNNIPVFCPGITDGATGNIISSFKSKNSNFKLDVSDDVVILEDTVLDAKETGAIILGGSLPKHHIMNANMMREGTKYTIYINTAMEGDGSDSGALPEEAKSWGKAAADVDSVKVQADTSIVFPLLVAGAFVE